MEVENFVLHSGDVCGALTTHEVVKKVVVPCSGPPSSLNFVTVIISIKLPFL